MMSFIVGLLAVVVVGAFYAVGKAIVDETVGFLDPHILPLVGNTTWVILISILFDLVVICLIGLVIRQIKFRTLINKAIGRVLPQKKHGALILSSPGVYQLAIIIKRGIRWRRLSGRVIKLCLVFYPSPPMGWTSGLPLGFVQQNKVFPINSSLQEILAIVTSLGFNAPDEIEEIKHQGTE